MPPLQNYAIGDLEVTILRKLLQNSLLTGALLTANQTSAVGTGGVLAAPYFDFRQGVRTYSASGAVVVPASATDVLTIYGSAAAGVYITRVTVSGFQTTAGLARLALIKRSAIDTGGTPVALTPIPHDAADAAAAATVNTYTAVPGALGAAVGNIAVAYVSIPVATGSGNPYEWDFGSRAKPVFLSGVAQGLALNLNAVTLAGCTLALKIEWYEI